MKHTIEVVTKVPDPATDDGNLCTPLGSIHRLPPQLQQAVALRGRMQVFHLGEILILCNGREPGGLGRKPSKWYIETQECASLKEAIELSQQVMAEWLRKLQ